ncbi:TPA: hypothetical protein SLN67_003533 [Serratia marcescens]|nr:hypothetical protein [Serratia marcescens]
MDINEQKNDKEKEANHKKLLERAESVTHAELAEYFTSFEKKHGDLPCPLCKTSLWAMPPGNEDHFRPLLVTLPLPFSNGMGVWSYPIFCTNCGYTVLFNTNHVASKIKGND